MAANVEPEQERLYMPSRWVVRVPEEEAVPLHVKLITEESVRLKKSVQDKRLGVVFGPSPGDWLDIYGEEGGRTGKMMVFISGGYWLQLSGEISSWTVQERAKSRLHFISPLSDLLLIFFVKIFCQS